MTTITQSCHIRLATLNDAPELARLRWDFSEHAEHDFPTFVEQFTTFLHTALTSGTWAIWVAEHQQRLIANIYLQLVKKVPRPGRPHAFYGYITNVYTEPFARNQGLGSLLMQAVQAWASNHHVEFLIVWPSEESVTFYHRAGFVRNLDILECDLPSNS